MNPKRLLHQSRQHSSALLTHWMLQLCLKENGGGWSYKREQTNSLFSCSINPQLPVSRMPPVTELLWLPGHSDWLSKKRKWCGTKEKGSSDTMFCSLSLLPLCSGWTRVSSHVDSSFHWLDSDILALYSGSWGKYLWGGHARRVLSAGQVWWGDVDRCSTMKTHAHLPLLLHT